MDSPLGLVDATVQDWQKQSESDLLEYAIPQVETTIWIQSDADLLARETIDVAVTESVVDGG